MIVLLLKEQGGWCDGTSCGGRAGHVDVGMGELDVVGGKEERED